MYVYIGGELVWGEHKVDGANRYGANRHGGETTGILVNSISDLNEKFGEITQS